jgi:hypothetical protein
VIAAAGVERLPSPPVAAGPLGSRCKVLMGNLAASNPDLTGLSGDGTLLHHRRLQSVSAVAATYSAPYRTSLRIDFGSQIALGDVSLLR